MDDLTFALAYAGFVVLGLNVVLELAGRGRRWVRFVMAAVIAAHVFLVWHHRFGWSAAYAWSKSPAGFLIFHSALALILAGAVALPPWSKRLLVAAFPIVCCGALGAAFRYDFVAQYRWPLVAAVAATTAGAMLVMRKTPPLQQTLMKVGSALKGQRSIARGVNPWEKSGRFFESQRDDRSWKEVIHYWFSALSPRWGWTLHGHTFPGAHAPGY